MVPEGALLFLNIELPATNSNIASFEGWERGGASLESIQSRGQEDPPPPPLNKRAPPRAKNLCALRASLSSLARRVGFFTVIQLLRVLL